MKAVAEKSVPIYRKIAYAAPAYALAVVGIPIYVYIPKFYTDIIGINVMVMGYILLSVRIFDAITDPAIGFISDRTKTPFGRRRPYIAVGSFFVSLSMYLLFNPPDASASQSVIWFGGCIFALFFFWTLVSVPYESLGPEITFDYNERISLFGVRDGFLIAGTLVAASSPALVEWMFNLSDTAQGERAKFFWIAVIYAPLVIGFSWWCAISITELPLKSVNRSVGILKGMRQMGQNRPFVILLIAYTISAIGNNLPATLILFYVEYVLHSNLADVFLLIYFVTGIIFLPGWISISRRIGKKKAWLTSMAINTGAFFGVFFLGPGDEITYGVLVFISGIGFGATLAIPSAIQADVIDYDEWLTGERREGQYIGLWSISKKLAAAVGVGAGLSILGAAGYTPNVEQSEQVKFVLRTLYALVPSVCNLIAILIAMAYPISSKVHENIRKSIDDRKKGIYVINSMKPMSSAA
ncbi:MAG: MFS transporter [Deltaproteobacteria bacterium]|jgi:GPH family glycoside/pentoside/hexuronide:cation symporter|nr:MFS transporter [Deltaproteobacteria bacterium]